MDIYRLAYWLEDLVPEIVELDGYLFVNRFGQSAAELDAKAKNYKSLPEAQSWMNIVLLDGFISEVVGGEWQPDGPSTAKLLSIFERAWSYQVRALYPNATFTIERLTDDESGDLGLRLLSK